MVLKGVVMFGWSSSIVGIRETMGMYSVSVSGSKVLRLLVIDLHWKYLSRLILNGHTRHLGACYRLAG